MGIGDRTPHASTVTYLIVTVPIRTDDGFPRRPYETKDMGPDSPGLNVCVLDGGWSVDDGEGCWYES